MSTRAVSSVLASLLVASLGGCGPQLDAAEAVGHARAGLTLEPGFGSNPGGLTLFLHEPAGLGPGAPLVVALHGCGQGAAEYVSAGWNALADQRRFLVAYPETSANTGCFDWFSAAQQQRTGAQVTSLLQAVQHLQQTRGVDPARVFVTGLSAGGAMANVLLAVAPDVFSRGAVVAGLPFGCATSPLDAWGCMTSPPDRTPTQWGDLVRAVAGGRPAPRVALWHGTADTTVRFGNLAEEVDQWTSVAGVDAVADVTTTVGPATRRQYRDSAGRAWVESWSLSGVGHGTPVDPPGCGAAGSFFLDVGLCSSQWAADFFGLEVAVDAGVTRDAGSPDAGEAPDAGSPGASPQDGGASDGGRGATGTPSGCGCASVAPGSALLALVTARRRRPRRP